MEQKPRATTPQKESPAENRIAVDLNKVAMKPFDPQLRRAAFSCGRSNMDRYLHESAEDQHKRSNSRIYYAVHNDQIIGYYSLAAASRNPNAISADAIKRFARILNAPCVYLGMFATHTACQRQGVGQKMMVHAMETTLRVAELIGVYALILDAVDQDVAERYRKWGFEYFIEGKAEYKMYIPLGTIRSAVQRAAKK